MHKSGDAEAALKAAAADRIVEATYRVPFLHHAAMEPINATAQFKDGKLTVWAGEQDAPRIKSRPGESVRPAGRGRHLVATPVGGAFGRRIPLLAAHWRRSSRSRCRWRRSRSR